jgi:hypothetical protein
MYLIYIPFLTNDYYIHDIFLQKLTHEGEILLPKYVGDIMVFDYKM